MTACSDTTNSVDLPGGLVAYFWADQMVWAIPLDLGVVTFPVCANEHWQFASHWSSAAMEACNEAEISPQQWWAAVKTVL